MTRLLSLFTCVLLIGNTAFSGAEADLLIAYDQSFVAHAGSEANAQVIAANAIAGTNAVNEHSGTGARMRVVGYYQAAQNLSGATTLGGYVGWMQNRDSRIVDVVDQGNALGADLVAFICQPISGQNVAAVAQQPGRFSAYGPPHFWLAIVAHEFGHNYGRTHNDGLLNPKSIMLHNYCGGGAAPPYVFTNRHIWFNDTHFVGDGDNCNQGPLRNSGDNSLSTLTHNQTVADRLERVVSGPNLDHVIHRWNFALPASAAPAGTLVEDDVGTATATVQGRSANFTGEGLRLPGSSAPRGSGYIELPPGIVSAHDEITIEIWAKPLSTESWARLLDFNNGTADYLMLSLSRGTNLGAQRFESRHGNTATTRDSNITTLSGKQHHYAITYTGNGNGGQWQWFRDGDAVGFLDVPHPLSSLQDVNNWLGRSAFDNHAFAHCEYAEVRISNVALTRDEILAHYLLGPNYDETATVMMTGNDPVGTSSLTQGGRWSDGEAPAPGNSYETFNHSLRTPPTRGSSTFHGDSLAITGGILLHKGTASNTITIPNLTASNTTFRHEGVGTATLAGGLEVTPEGALFHSANAGFHVAADISGNGPLTYRGVHPVTLAGDNSGFTGRTVVGDGNVGVLAIDSPGRLGPAPASPAADHLAFNRGTLRVTETMALDDPNRGIFFDVNGGTFDVAAGATLTISSPLSARFITGNITGGAIYKQGSGTLVLDSDGSTFHGTLSIDSGSSSDDDGIVRIANSNTISSARRIHIRNTNSGRSTLQFDGSGGDLQIHAPIETASRNNNTPTLHHLAGNSTLNGNITLNAGGNGFNIRSDQGRLTLNGTHRYVGNHIGERTFAFSGAGDHRVNGPILRSSNDAPVSVVKTGGGTLTLAGANTYDGATALQEGTLILNGSITASSANLTTAPGTILAGTGATDTQVALGGTHAPGDPAGAQTFNGSLDYTATASLRWRLVGNNTATDAYGRVSAQAVSVAPGATIDLVFDTPGSVVRFNDTFWTEPRAWTLVTATSLSGSFSLGTVGADTDGRPAGNHGVFTLEQTGSTVELHFTPHATSPLDSWRQANFGDDWDNPAIAGDLADPDNDGLANLIEYALGTDPNHHAADAAPRVAIEDDKLVITFTRNPAAGDVTISVMAADAPDTGNWTEIARSSNGEAMVAQADGVVVSEHGDDTIITVEVTDKYLISDPEHPRRFLRLSVAR